MPNEIYSDADLTQICTQSESATLYNHSLKLRTLIDIFGSNIIAIGKPFGHVC